MTISEQKINEIKRRFDIVGNSPLLHRAIEFAIKVAPTDLAVLIFGQSGVGKEAFSKIIHSLSKRKHNQFIAINCGAIPEGTIDSELFGHEKGAFTSAHETRKGYFETVNGGTIFLDEIGELPLGTQSRLLRVIETGEFLKVGSSKVQKTDVRVIAATNKDLHEQIDANRFREDLFYRLSTVNIKIPPLRERQEDIRLLFAKFASDFASKHNIPPIEITEEAEQILYDYHWPGNIRQLKNFVEEISVLEADRKMDSEKIKKYLPKEKTRELSYYKADKDSENFRGYEEREILFKFLFDMKREVSEVKSLLYEMLEGFSGDSKMPRSYSPEYRRLLGAGSSRQEAEEVQPGKKPLSDPQFQESEEITENEDQPLSLQSHEQDMIKKALQKHKGKRKAAARELGISERTLYRKIKEYQLENY